MGRNGNVLVDEEEVGGLVKTRRTNGRPRERPEGKNNKTPLHPGHQKGPGPEVNLALPPEEPQVQVAHVAQVVPPEKKEEVNVMEKKKATQATVVSQAQPQYEICALCGHFSKLPQATTDKNYLVCKADNDRWLEYARKVAQEMVAGRKPKTSKIEWVLSQLDIPRFERELEWARQERNRLNDRVDEKLNAHKADKSLDIEILKALRMQYQQTLQREDYFLVRRLFARLEAAKKLKPKLEQMIAEAAAKKAAEAANAAETAPETPATNPAVSVTVPSS